MVNTDKLVNTTMKLLIESYGNSGYVGNSKSVRAYQAEEDSKYSATESAKKLGVSVEAIKTYLYPTEWHHTGSYYNKTDYYDIYDYIIYKYYGEQGLIDQLDYDEEDIKRVIDTYNNMKNYKKEKPEEITYKADVDWLTWEGTRKHPKAIQHRVENVDVLEKGSFYYFKDEYGNDTKKKIGSNGTYVTKKN